LTATDISQTLSGEKINTNETIFNISKQTNTFSLQAIDVNVRVNMYMYNGTFYWLLPADLKLVKSSRFSSNIND